MDNSNIFNNILEVYYKMGIMQTVLEVLLDMVDEQVKNKEDAIAYAAQKDSMDGLVHVLIDYNADGIKILDEIQQNIPESIFS